MDFETYVFGLIMASSAVKTLHWFLFWIYVSLFKQYHICSILLGSSWNYPLLVCLMIFVSWAEINVEKIDQLHQFGARQRFRQMVDMVEVYMSETEKSEFDSHYDEVIAEDELNLNTRPGREPHIYDDYEDNADGDIINAENIEPLNDELEPLEFSDKGTLYNRDSMIYAEYDELTRHYNFGDMEADQHGDFIRDLPLRRRDSVIETNDENAQQFNSFNSYFLHDEYGEQTRESDAVDIYVNDTDLIHEIAKSKKYNFGCFGFFFSIKNTPVSLYPLFMVDMNVIISDVRRRRFKRWERPWLNEHNNFGLRSTSLIFFENQSFSTTNSFYSENWFDAVISEISKQTDNYGPTNGIDEYDTEAESNLLVPQFLAIYISSQNEYDNRENELIAEFTKYGYMFEKDTILEEDEEDDDSIYPGEISPSDIQSYYHIIHEQPLFFKWTDSVVWPLRRQFIKQKKNGGKNKRGSVVSPKMSSKLSFNHKFTFKNYELDANVQRKLFINKQPNFFAQETEPLSEAWNPNIFRESFGDHQISHMPWDFDHIKTNLTASSRKEHGYIAKYDAYKDFPILVKAPIIWSSKIPDLLPIFVSINANVNIKQYNFTSINDFCFFRNLGCNSTRFRFRAMVRRKMICRRDYFIKFKYNVMWHLKKKTPLSHMHRMAIVLNTHFLNIRRSLQFWRKLSIVRYSVNRKRWFANTFKVAKWQKFRRVIERGNIGRINAYYFNSYSKIAARNRDKQRPYSNRKVKVNIMETPYRANSVMMEHNNHSANIAYGYDEYSGSIVSSMYDLEQKNFQSTIQALPSSWAIQRHQVYWPSELYGPRPRANGIASIIDATIPKLFGYELSPRRYNKEFSLLKNTQFISIEGSTSFFDIQSYVDIAEALKYENDSIDGYAIEPIYYTRNQNFVVDNNHTMPKIQNFDLLKHYFMELPIRDIQSAVFPNISASDEQIPESPDWYQPVDQLLTWHRYNFLLYHFPSEWKNALSVYRQLYIKIEIQQKNAIPRHFFTPTFKRQIFESEAYGYGRPDPDHYEFLRAITFYEYGSYYRHNVDEEASLDSYSRLDDDDEGMTSTQYSDRLNTEYGENYNYYDEEDEA